MHSEYVVVTFKVNCETLYGETVGIVGNIEALNKWSLKRVSYLSTTPETYPEWGITISLPVLEDIEYKYVIYSENTGMVKWEATYSNRKLEVKGLTMVVRDGNFGELVDKNQGHAGTWVDSGWLIDSVQLFLKFGGNSGKKPYFHFSPREVGDFDDEEDDEPSYYFNITPLKTKTKNGSFSSSPEFEVTQATDDDNVFTIDAKRIRNLSMRIELRQRVMSGSDVLGFCNIHHSEFVDKIGMVSRPLTAENSYEVTGLIVFHYVVAMPFTHEKNNLSSIWRMYWRKGPALSVGHRGLGENVSHYKEADTVSQLEARAKLAKPRGDLYSRIISENSILSFVTAGRYGASFVEMDVQLTFDSVPVISHDFSFLIRPSPSDCIGPQVPVELNIHDMKWSELQRFKPIPRTLDIEAEEGPKFCGSYFRAVKSIKGESKDDSEVVRDSIWQIRSRLALLKEVLRELPRDTGINLEIKWPSWENTKNWKAYPERNVGLDAILRVLFDEAGDRRILLSSFDPDVCILLRSKQPKYPVLFITDCGSTPGEKDRRRTSLASAIRFSKTYKLNGIVSESSALIEYPKMIRQIKELGMILVTYGAKNNNAQFVKLQRDNGVDAIISDNPHTFSSGVQNMVKDGKKIVSAET